MSTDPKNIEDTEEVEKTVSKKRHAKKRGESYRKYIRDTLHGIDTETSMTRESLNIMNSIVEDIFQRLAVESGKIAAHASRQTITDREIEAACVTVIRGHLGAEATMDGRKAVAKYRASNLTETA